nr:hypothetical protein [Deltaproteobacteria bacterium]
MRAGQRQRWRIVNAGSARFYRLALPGHRFTVVGTDGGPVETPRASDELLLVPGDRLDVLVDGTGAPGSTPVLQVLPYARGHGMRPHRGGGPAAAAPRPTRPAALDPPAVAPHRAARHGRRRPQW